MIKISNLNKRIKIESPKTFSDEVGGFKTIWEELGEFWAEIKPITHNKIKDYNEEGLNINNSNILEIIIRYKNDITSGLRIIYKDKYYSVKRVINIGENNIFMNLLVQEVKYE